MLRSTIIYLIINLVMCTAVGAVNEHDPVTELARYEAEHNNERGRKKWQINPRHINVPYDYIEHQNLIKDFPDWLREALIFEENGQKYLRWIIHPDDREIHKIFISSIKNTGRSAKIENYFSGYLTASRSMFIQDPKTKRYFSVKVSTDHINGESQKKIWQTDEALAARTVSDLMTKMVATHPLKHLVILRDIASFSVADSRQNSISIRELTPLEIEGRVYVPGFSVTDSRLGREIAMSNGSDNPAEYWREHYVQPVAKAMAELALYTGMSPDSLHGQNVLVEMKKLNGTLKPTGRIVMRDLADVYINSELFSAAFNLKTRDFIKRHHEVSDQLIKGKLKVEMTLLGRSGAARNAPEWLKPSDYNEWGKSFFESFESQLGELAKTSVEDLRKTRMVNETVFTSPYSAGFSKSYNLKTDAWRSRIERMHPAAHCQILEEAIIE